MRFSYLFILSVFLWSCGGDSASTTNGNTSTNSSSVVDNSAYQITEIPGSDIKMAKRIDGNGMMTEDGLLLNDQKTGAWTTYFMDNKVKSITNYVNGKKNGIMMELSDRSQLTLQTNYLDDQLHGRQAKYGFSRKIEEEAHYKNGKLDGSFKSFDKQGKLNREIHYKDGQLHGPNIFYNEGVKTVEYEYKNGEKVGGGILEK